MKPLGPRSTRLERLADGSAAVFFEELSSEMTESELEGISGLLRTGFDDDVLMLEFGATVFWLASVGRTNSFGGRVLIEAGQDSRVCEQLSTITRNWQRGVADSITVKRPSIAAITSRIFCAYPRSLVEIRQVLSLANETIVLPIVDESDYIIVGGSDLLVVVSKGFEPVLKAAATRLNLTYVNDSYSQYQREVYEQDYYKEVKFNLGQLIAAAGFTTVQRG